LLLVAQKVFDPVGFMCPVTFSPSCCCKKNGDLSVDGMRTYLNA
jgi:hypothetical protein